jgi:uncharacterized membrane protein
MHSHTGEWQLPADAPFAGVRTTTRLLRREVWRYLPAWMYFAYGALLLNAELTNLSPSRADLAWTIVFPLGVFLAFTGVRSMWAPDVKRRLTMLGITVSLALGLPLLNLLVHRPSPMELPTLRLWYELSNFAWAGLFMVHAYKRNKTLLPLFFGAAFVYGALLENGGIALGFFHETNLPLTMIPPLVAPFATMVGWSLVLYLATFITWCFRAWLPWLKHTAVGSAVLLAVIATLLDLQIDPLATATGCWVWDSSLPGWFEGVPLVNFVAWMCAVFPFAWVMFRYQQVHDIADAGRWSPRHLWRMTALAPVTLLLAGVCFVGATLVVEGSQGPSWTLLSTFLARWVSF